MFSLSPASDMREYSGIIKEMQDHKETLICKSNALTELTNEKQDLLSNLERTQQELEQTKQKLTQSKNTLSSQLKISCLREKELVALESKWRASMEHERKESEILRLEMTHRFGVETLQHEMGELKKVHHEALKEHVMYKTTQEVALTNAIRDAETAIEARENDASTFAETIQNLLLESSVCTSKINALQSDLQECQLRMKQMTEFESKMRAELRQTLQDKKQREADIVQIETKCSQESKYIQAKNALLESELYGLRSESTHLKQVVESTKLELYQARDVILYSKEEFKQVLKESSAKENSILCMMEEAETEKQRLEHTIKSLTSNIKESKNKFDADMELYRDELEVKRVSINRFQCEAISMKDRTNREYQHSLHTLEIENASLKKRALMLENELSTSDAEKEQSSWTLNQAAELCQHELNIALKKTIVLTDQNATLEDLTKDAKQQYLALQTKLDKTTDEFNAIRSELVALENRAGELSMQNEVISSNLRDQTEELLRERQAKESALKKSNHSDKIFQKEKRKSDAYKQKALEARANNLLLKSMPK